jgi:apolipoprotein N-acyltransferase
MTESRETRRRGVAFRPGLWLILAGFLWFFAGGRYVVGVAAWLAPVFMLRWLRGRRVAVGFPLAVLVAAAANFFAWRGIADVMMAAGLYFIFVAAAAVVYLTPYVADRALSRRLGGFASTLIFPAAVVTLEYVLSLVSPLGTWNAVAYTQTDNVPLIQLASVTGLYGVTFVVAWFGAVVNWAWQNSFGWQTIKRGAITYALVVTAIMFFGGARLAFSRPGETVRVAGIISRPFFLSEHPEIWEPLLTGRPLDGDEAQAFRAETAAINEDLLARSRREARAGAKVILWGEAGAQLLARDEKALVAGGRELARQERIYLGMALATLNPGETKSVTNKFVFINPAGDVVWDYLKSYPVPGPEAAVTRRGDGRIPTRATPYGRFAGSICYDMDFPTFIRQAGRAGADVMFVPAHDWDELGDLHAKLAVFRAVENGFSLFRPDNDAVSVATDYVGRPLATMDYSAAADPVITAHLPTRGVRTVYARVGDVFAWLAVTTFLAVGIWALFSKCERRPDKH